MKFLWWRKIEGETEHNGHLESEREQAQLAKKQAQYAVARAEQAMRDVKPVAAELRRERGVNHFTSAFRDAFGG